MKKQIGAFFCLLLCCCSATMAQNAQVNGTVLDEKGPLQGVTVLVKGSASGTQTDVKGNFSIPAALNDTGTCQNDHQPNYSGNESRAHRLFPL